MIASIDTGNPRPMKLPDANELNLTDIAKLFRVRRATVSEWVGRYELQYREVGNNKLVPKAELQRLARLRLEEGKA